MLHPGASRNIKIAAAIVGLLVAGFFMYSYLTAPHGRAGAKSSPASGDQTLSSRSADARQTAAKRKRTISAPEAPSTGLKFYGFAKKHDQGEQVFISQGNDVFVGRVGDIVGRHYKIVHIAANSVELEDLLNNRRLTLPLVKEKS